MKGPKYKVKVWDGIIYPADDLEFQNLLNCLYLEGWKLKQTIPQQEDGETKYTVLIFTSKV